MAPEICQLGSGERAPGSNCCKTCGKRSWMKHRRRKRVERNGRISEAPQVP